MATRNNLWNKFNQRPPYHKPPKLTMEQVDDIRNRYATGERLASIAKDYAHIVSYQTVHDAAVGKTYYLPRREAS